VPGGTLNQALIHSRQRIGQLRRNSECFLLVFWTLKRPKTATHEIRRNECSNSFIELQHVVNSDLTRPRLAIAVCWLLLLLAPNDVTLLQRAAPAKRRCSMHVNKPVVWTVGHSAVGRSAVGTRPGVRGLGDVSRAWYIDDLCGLDHRTTDTVEKCVAVFHRQLIVTSSNFNWQTSTSVHGVALSTQGSGWRPLRPDYATTAVPSARPQAGCRYGM